MRGARAVLDLREPLQNSVSYTRLVAFDRTGAEHGPGLDRDETNRKNAWPETTQNARAIAFASFASRQPAL